MRYLLLLIVLNVNLVVPALGAMKTDLDRDKLLGSVHRVIQKDCPDDEAGMVIQPWIRTYDRRGYWIDYGEHKVWKKEHDSQGRLTKRSLDWARGSISITETLSYPAKGGIRHVLKKYIPESYLGPAETITVTSHYDSKGILMGDSSPPEEFDEADQKSIVSTRYRYNKQGEMIKTVTSNGDGSLRTKTLYRYDEKGELIEALISNADGSVKGKELYHYESIPTGKITVYFFYDAEGKLIKKKKTISDHHGNETGYTFEIFHPDPPLKTEGPLTRYVYDERGNWTERVATFYPEKNTPPFRTFCREIIYY